jgi:integrase
MLKWDTAWRALRDVDGLHGLRFHDLRHTVITSWPTWVPGATSANADGRPQMPRLRSGARIEQ